MVGIIRCIVEEFQPHAMDASLHSQHLIASQGFSESLTVHADRSNPQALGTPAPSRIPYGFSSTLIVPPPTAPPERTLSLSFSVLVLD